MTASPTKSFFVLGVFLPLLLSGCVVMPEGVGLKTMPTEKQWSKMKSQLVRNKERALEKGFEVEKIEPGVIVVGRVGPFRAFSDESTFKKAYKRHSELMTSIGEEENIVPPDELASMASGWTTITFAGVPWIAFLMGRAYVPVDLQNEADFPSNVETVFGGREDLVAAVSSQRYASLFVVALLCEDGEDFPGCKREYEQGLYDVYTGQELTKKYKLKKNGTLIDTRSFKIVQE